MWIDAEDSLEIWQLI